MNRKLLTLGFALLLTLGALVAPASAAASALYDIQARWGDTYLPPGGEGQFALQVRNIGTEDGKGVMKIEDKLPAGVKVTNIALPYGSEAGNLINENSCTGIGTETATCLISKFWVNGFNGFGLAQAPGTKGIKPNGFGDNASLEPNGYMPQMIVDVAVEPGVSGTGTNVATVSGAGAAEPASDVAQVSFSPTPSSFGLLAGSYLADFFDAAYPFGSPVRRAGDHPFEFRFNFDLNEKSGIGGDGTRFIASHGAVKTADVTLPLGMIGNPEALPKCDAVDFAEEGSTPDSTACPADTQVGYITIPVMGGEVAYGQGPLYANANDGTTYVPIYNLVPPEGEPADLGFNAGGVVQAHIYPNVDPARSYAITSLVPNISSLLNVRGSETTIWGVPGDPAHDKFRYYPEAKEDGSVAGAPFDAPIRPLLTTPMDCGVENGGTRARFDSYTHPGQFTPTEEWPSPMNVNGCDDPRFRFEPDVALSPTDKHAGAPTGLEVHLAVPQRNDEAKQAAELYAPNGNVKGISTPPIKKAVVTLPEGMTVNPAAAQGLGSCTPAQIGLGTDSPVRCPDDSQYGTIILHTPILPVDAQPEGFVYIAKQNDNPFHNFLSLYLVIQEPQRGILIKVPGRVDLDPDTGRITTTFDDLPQLPLSDMEMRLKGGLRAGLVNPQTCGRKTIEATFYSWQSPDVPHAVKSSYEVDQNPDGTPCRHSLAERPFDPSLSGGTRNNLAGSFSPMDLRVSRGDEDQELSRVEGTAPPGLLASLRGVGRCSDSQIAGAAAVGRSGTEEIESPSCPASSQVGTVDAGAGVGQVLTYVHGKIYLAGPYKGAPLSGVAIVPAVAGPFDLGTIVTRAPAYVDRSTAQLRVVTDPLPLIFKGIPVRVRDIGVHLDRPHFILNPTSCEPFRLSGLLISSEGKSTSSGSPFQAADCSALGFKPHLNTSLSGGTLRGGHPALKGVFKARAGDANPASVTVTLPHSEFLDQSHIRTVCTRVQFAANSCPAGSVYGHAVAKTPLLDEALEGPVYLRSSSHKLPDLVADLHGIIDVEVVGRIASVHGGIRANFESIPDAPVESFTLSIQGGKKGLLINSQNLCAGTHRADARFRGQNGREVTLKPALKAACAKQGRKKKNLHLNR